MLHASDTLGFPLAPQSGERVPERSEGGRGQHKAAAPSRLNASRLATLSLLRGASGKQPLSPVILAR